MGLPSKMFFMMFVRMIWYRDVVGLLVKGTLFGLFTAAARLLGTRLRRRRAGIQCRTRRLDVTVDVRGGDPSEPRACRWSPILVVNMTWFILIYHAVPFYGPSLLQPPTP